MIIGLLTKLAATKENKSSHRKFEMKWELRKEYSKDNDVLFDFFTKLYDMIEGVDYKDKDKDFAIMIGGKSYRIDRKKYYYYNTELKEEVEKRIVRDWSKVKDSNDGPVKASG